MLGDLALLASDRDNTLVHGYQVALVPSIYTNMIANKTEIHDYIRCFNYDD
jgi:hypothetical protein